ncbi:TPA: hypothetical protein DEO28_02370 [Candidatus Dependentiae bacterium]|nr:MAG: ATP synthase subunit b [candidate division TM6 bacterium GW2011_GWE2_31_21]KKP53238.1 MAG: ATP synthase subunit b [candidate division TM6 bacterium GW2011_GWF2_33_332]HBS48063.1 hypothetical protein [Candidatus Dependentiae bacterium]HBZ73334.1 hypothetical protein [Candidatus Dependentiae bacterium]
MEKTLIEFNFTIFIQIINFIITYQLLNKFVFRPVLNFLEQKKNKEKVLTVSLQTEEKVIDEMQQQKELKLFNFQQKMHTKTVELIKEPVKISTFVTYQRNQKEVEDSIKQFKNVLIKEVSRVR